MTRRYERPAAAALAARLGGHGMTAEDIVAHTLPSPPRTTLDGATTPGEEFAWPANAGEFAARWNEADTEQRDAWVRSIVDNAEAASRCFRMAHRQQVELLQHMQTEQRDRMLATLRTEGEAVPGARSSDPSTSHQAAASVSGTPTARNHMGRLLLAYLRHERHQEAREAARLPGTDRAMTSEEAAALADLHRAEFAKRCSDLVTLGYLRVARDEHGHERTRQGRSGRQRLVFELTDHGRATAEGIEVKAL